MLRESRLYSLLSKGCTPNFIDTLYVLLFPKPSEDAAKSCTTHVQTYQCTMFHYFASIVLSQKTTGHLSVSESLDSLPTCINLDRNSRAAVLSSFGFKAVSGEYH